MAKLLHPHLLTKGCSKSTSPTLAASNYSSRGGENNQQEANGNKEGGIWADYNDEIPAVESMEFTEEVNFQFIKEQQGTPSATESILADQYPFLTKINLKPLPYDLGDLEPYMSGTQLETHYARHHQTYVNNVNRLMEEAHAALKEDDLEMYVQVLPQLIFNAGAHLNHEFFWETLCPVFDGGG